MAQPLDSEVVVKVVGPPGCALTYKIRDFLHRSDVKYEWIPLATVAEARVHLPVDDLHDSRLPLCLFSDGSRLERPTIRQITEKLGWYRDPSLAEYDLAIYGGGPAGLSAALYGASEGLRTVLIERSAIGGQAGSSSKIENYLGFPDGISGREMAQRAQLQARRFGAEILMAREGVRAELPPGRGVGYLPTAPRSSPGPRFALRAWTTLAWVCRPRTNSWAWACTTAPAPAKPR